MLVGGQGKGRPCCNLSLASGDGVGEVFERVCCRTFKKTLCMEICDSTAAIKIKIMYHVDGCQPPPPNDVNDNRSRNKNQRHGPNRSAQIMSCYTT